MSETLAKYNSLEVALGLQGKSPVELFYENPSSILFGRVPEGLQTPEMALLLIKKDKYSIKSIPQKLLTSKVCELAIENDASIIKYIPSDLITRSLALKAVRCSLEYPSELIKFPEYVNFPINFVPSNLITKELVLESVRYSPCSLKNVPSKFISNRLIKVAVSGDGRSLEFVPEDMRSPEICEIAFENNIYAFKWIPTDYVTRKMLLKIIEAPSSIARKEVIKLDYVQGEIQKDKDLLNLYTQRLNRDEKAKTTEQEVSIEKGKKIACSINNSSELDNEELPSMSEYSLVPESRRKSITHELVEVTSSTGKNVYYITDIHLEHQMKDLLYSNDADYSDIENTIHKFVDKKISDMLSYADDENGVLLIGGDVSNSLKLSTIFYKQLYCRWRGTIISILGNHELWDTSPMDVSCKKEQRTITDITNDYRDLLNERDQLGNVTHMLLQNSLYILYKNKQGRVIEEEQILRSTDDDLRDICLKSSFIVLGGIGFSGLNPVYNAERGLYRTAITTIQEDKVLSDKFRAIYDKVNLCAGDIQVIVLTHMPVYNWTNEPYNPNWVYINGHTHQNSLIRKSDGTTVLSDNQIGYKPQKWILNAFTVSGWYDPLKKMNDGIHEISSEAYNEFNCGRGIQSNSSKLSGKIYALKRQGTYMFLLKSQSQLYLLQGGKRCCLDCCDEKYYFDNMSLYTQKIRQAFLPYQQVIQAISKEVKLIGGWGSAHGCIVDINSYNHIYVNPFDGKLTPYFALNINFRIVYNTLLDLLKAQKPELIEKFQSAYENDCIPILSRYALTMGKSLPQIKEAVIPRLVVGTEIYEPSNIMRSIQYIFDNNVIRNWHNVILSMKIEQPSIEGKSEPGE